MLVIKINVWPGGDWNDPQEVASLELTNVTGTAQVADYDVLLRPDNRHVTVYGHQRSEGWLPLARAALRAADPNGGFYTSPAARVPDDVLPLLDLAPYTSRACQTARAVLACQHPDLAPLLAARGVASREAWAGELFRMCRETEKYTGLQCQDPQHQAEPLPPFPFDEARCMSCDLLTDDCTCTPTEEEIAAALGPAELTREELQELVDRQGLDLYRAQDRLAFVREMCDLADRNGEPVTTARVRSWLEYTGCGGMIVLGEAPESLRAPAMSVDVRCFCGDPIVWMSHPSDPGWIHAPGSDTPCLRARPAVASLASTPLPTPATDQPAGVAGPATSEEPS